MFSVGFRFARSIPASSTRPGSVEAMVCATSSWTAKMSFRSRS